MSTGMTIDRYTSLNEYRLTSVIELELNASTILDKLEAAFFRGGSLTLDYIMF